MKQTYSSRELIEFEDEVASLFNNGKIKAPVHLYYGNENEILRIFEEINENDWIFTTWRSHYQALLKGVPKDLIIQNILEGKSIAQCFPAYRFYSSAIVTGNIPIALGTAVGIKRLEQSNKVWCFIGDMTSETGMANSAIKYARNHELPIKFIVEDNGVSVMTDTRQVWNSKSLSFEKIDDDYIYYYSYKSKYPHAGAGVRVQF